MKRLRIFLLPLLLMLLGAGLWVAPVVVLVRAMGSGMDVAAPGPTRLTIDRPGQYTLWNQTTALVQGQWRSYPEKLPAGSSIVVTRLADGAAVPLRGSMNATETVGSTKRLSLADLTIPAAGQYEITCPGLQEPRMLYLRQSLLASILSTALSACGGSVLFVAGVIWLVVLGVMRLSRGKRQTLA